MSIIDILSPYGGVATTTTAITLAYAFAQEGYCTLLFDLQEVARCAQSLSFDPAPSAYDDWLMGHEPLSAHTITVRDNGLQLLRNHIAISHSLNHLRFGSHGDMVPIVSKLRDVAVDSWIIIDTPRFNLIEDAVIAAADIIIIPFRADSYKWHTVNAKIQLVGKLNPNAKVILLPTVFSKRSKRSQDFLEVVQKQYGDLVAQPIPMRSSVVDTICYAKTIWEYKGNGIKDVRGAYSALMAQLLPDVTAAELRANFASTKSYAKNSRC